MDVARRQADQEERLGRMNDLGKDI